MYDSCASSGLIFWETVCNERAKFFDSHIINADTFSYAAQD